MDLALIAGPKQMDQGMIDREIVLGMSLLYVASDLRPEGAITTGLADLTDRLRPMSVIQTDPVDEFRPRRSEPKTSEIVASPRVDHENLIISSTP